MARAAALAGAPALAGATVAVVGQLCLAQARRSVPSPPDSSGLPKPMNGALAWLCFANRRSAPRLETEGSTLMAVRRASQSAWAYLMGSASVSCVGSLATRMWKGRLVSGPDATTRMCLAATRSAICPNSAR